jgi:hypothetical protein
MSGRNSCGAGKAFHLRCYRLGAGRRGEGYNEYVPVSTYRYMLIGSSHQGRIRDLDAVIGGYKDRSVGPGVSRLF